MLAKVSEAWVDTVISTLSPTAKLTAWVMSVQLPPVPNVQVIPLLTAFLRTFSTPEDELTPPVCEMHRRLVIVPGELSAYCMALIAVHGPPPRSSIVVDGEAVPVHANCSTAGMPLICAPLIFSVFGAAVSNVLLLSVSEVARPTN